LCYADITLYRNCIKYHALAKYHVGVEKVHMSLLAPRFISCSCICAVSLLTVCCAACAVLRDLLHFTLCVVLRELCCWCSVEPAALDPLWASPAAVLLAAVLCGVGARGRVPAPGPGCGLAEVVMGGATNRHRPQQVQPPMATNGHHPQWGEPPKATNRHRPQQVQSPTAAIDSAHRWWSHQWPEPAPGPAADRHRPDPSAWLMPRDAAAQAPAAVETRRPRLPRGCPRLAEPLQPPGPSACPPR